MSPCPDPSTTPIDSGDASTITFEGTVVPGDTAVLVYFRYGTDNPPTQHQTSMQLVPAGTNAVAVSSQVSGLQPNTTYYSTLVAVPVPSGGGGGGGTAPADAGGFRPHYVGFGTTTRAAWGHPTAAPALIRVNTLSEWVPLTQNGANDYSGSLMAALMANFPRVIVFEISGNIVLSSVYVVFNPYFVIAGQTAPSPGITVWTRQTIYVRTHDWVIQHVRFVGGGRSGAVSSTLTLSNTFGDGWYQAANVWVGGDCHNFVFDHCAFLWASYLNLVIGNPTGGTDNYGGPNAAQPYNGSVLDCLNAQSVHPGGGAGNGADRLGTLVFGNPSNTGTITFARTIHAFNVSRNPLIQGGR